MRAMFGNPEENKKILNEKIELPEGMPDVSKDIPEDVAKAAYSGISFRSDERAKSVVRDYIGEMKAWWETVLPHVKEEQRAEFLADFQSYREGYKKRYLEYLRSMSNVVSPMIAGPSNFPFARMQKRNRWVQNKSNALREWDEKVTRKILAKYKGLSDNRIVSGTKDALSKLKEKLQSLESLQERMKKANELIRKARKDKWTVAKLKEELLKIGFSDKMASDLIKPDFAGRMGFTFHLANNSAEIRRVKDRIKAEEMQKQEATQDENEVFFAGGSILKNYEANRVQIFFKDKPGPELIAKLKRRAFRWSPSNKAWQRQLTVQAVKDAAEITGAQLQSKPKEAPLVCPPMDANGELRIDQEGIEGLKKCIASQPDTKELNTDPEGNYTPDRKAFHRKLIDEFKAQKPCVNFDKPIAILTGGPPGSGKSTFLKKFAPWITSGKLFHIDADEVRAKLPEYKGWNADRTHRETSDIVRQMLDEIGKPCRHDLIYDGTMNKAKNYMPLIEHLKELGYLVFVIYISVPKEVSVKRVLERYKKSGRYVPMQVIDEVFDRGLEGYEAVVKKADGYIRVDGVTQEIIESGGIGIPTDRRYEAPCTDCEEVEEEIREVLQDAAQVQASRKPRAVAMDAAAVHKTVRAPSKESLKQWKKDPGKSDIAGVDSPLDAAITVHKKRDKSFIAFLSELFG
jgi:predicted ABC-type ATPase